MKKEIELMTRQIQELCYLTKLQIILDEMFIPKWVKVLDKKEIASLKTSKTLIGKVLDSLGDRMDRESLKKYVFMLQNTSMLNIPKKEVNEALRILEQDTRLVDVAMSHCDPCTIKDSLSCEIRQALDDAKYPAMWEGEHLVKIDMTDDENKCMGHCRHCVNLKLSEV